MRNFLITFKLAYEGVFTNKLRTFLTMLGIIIGVASVITIISIGAGAQSLITGSIKTMGTNLIGVIPGASDDKGPPASAFGIVIKTLTYDDAKAIRKIPNVVGISAYARGTGEIVRGSKSLDGNFSGITSEYPLVENHNVEKGRFFTNQEERSGARIAVLGADIKEELFPFDNPISQTIRIKKENFTIIGVMEKKGSSMFSNPDNQVFIPLATAQKILLGVKHLGLIRVKIDSEENIKLVMIRVEKLLKYRHKIKNDADVDFSLNSLAEALDTLTAVTSGLKFFLACIAAISLIVGGIGITNIMLMTVKERTMEIGLKKAIGAKPSQIENQFIIETLVLTGIGGILGIIFGVVISYVAAVIIRQMGYEWEFVVTSFSIIISFLVATMVGLVFGIHPARKAARLNPIESLRYE